MQRNVRSDNLWQRTAPPAPVTTSLSGETTADVVVIGGGYTGLSSALHLAEGGATVVLLEGVEIGFGGSGRNVGLVNAGMWMMPDHLLEELGPNYGERLLRLLGNAPKRVFELIEMHDIACEVERAGTLHCAVGASGLAELEQRAAQWDIWGAPVSLLDAKETAAKVGTTAYAGSLLDRRAGTIQPLAYARGLARAAIGAGARIFTTTSVVDVEKRGQRWKVRTAAGAVTAEWVVVATNAYTTTPWPQIRTELVNLPYFNFATEPLADHLRAAILPERQGVWDTNVALSSFRFDQVGRLIVGSVGALRNTGTFVHRKWTQRALRRIFPQIGEVAFEAQWYGMIGMTDNSLPKLHLFAPNVIGFSGYNGRGIAPGTAFGGVIAKHIAGEILERELPLPFTDPRERKFRKLRETAFEMGAQLTHLTGPRF